MPHFPEAPQSLDDNTTMTIRPPPFHQANIQPRSRWILQRWLHGRYSQESLIGRVTGASTWQGKNMDIALIALSCPPPAFPGLHRLKFMQSIRRTNATGWCGLFLPSSELFTLIKALRSCNWIALLQKLKYIGKAFAKMKILIERSQQGWIFQFVFSSPPLLHFG